MRHTISTKILGLLFIVVGVGYVGEYTGIWSFTIFFRGWWALLFIIPAILSMIDNGIQYMNSAVALFGFYVLARLYDLIDYRLTFGVIASICCILLGLKILFGGRKDNHKRERFHKNYTPYEENIKNEKIRSTVYFGSRKVHAHGKIASVHGECVLGSQVIDLSQCDLMNVQFVTIDSVLGNVEVIVRDSMHYVVNKSNVLGSCVIEDGPRGSYDLHVDVSCVLGQVVLRKVSVSDTIFD